MGAAAPGSILHTCCDGGLALPAGDPKAGEEPDLSERGGKGFEGIAEVTLSRSRVREDIEALASALEGFHPYSCSRGQGSAGMQATPSVGSDSVSRPRGDALAPLATCREVSELRWVMHQYRVASRLSPSDGNRIQGLSHFVAGLETPQRALLAGTGLAGLAELRALVEEDIWSLHMHLRRFCTERSIPERQVTLDEAVQCVRGMCSRFGTTCLVSNRMIAELLGPYSAQASDGRFDLFEAVGVLLDRKVTSVELVLYDISQGTFWVVSPMVLGRQFEALYHTSVLVNGAEFWYGGCIFENEPPIDRAVFGPPLTSSCVELHPSGYRADLRVVRMGPTLVTEEEMRAFVKNMLKKKYTPETYDVLENNCNHFSQDLVCFLTGSDIPDAVLKLPDHVMDTPTAKFLRPLLNRWLRGFRAGPCEGDRRRDPDEVRDEDLCMSLLVRVGCRPSMGSELQDPKITMDRWLRGWPARSQHLLS